MHALQYKLIVLDRWSSLLAVDATHTHEGGGMTGLVSETLHREEGAGLHCSCDRSFSFQTVHVMHGFVPRCDLAKLTISNSAFPPPHERLAASWTILKKMKLLPHTSTADEN